MGHDLPHPVTSLLSGSTAVHIRVCLTTDTCILPVLPFHLPLFAKFEKVVPAMTREDESTRDQNDNAKSSATLTIDALESRILLSATWTDGDTDEPLEGPSVHNDIFHGSSGRDIAHALDGDDLLFGEAGNDQLFGDGGDDGLFGGAGRRSLERRRRH